MSACDPALDIFEMSFSRPARAKSASFARIQHTISQPNDSFVRDVAIAWNIQVPIPVHLPTTGSKDLAASGNIAESPCGPPHHQWAIDNGFSPTTLLSQLWLTFVCRVVTIISLPRKGPMRSSGNTSLARAQSRLRQAGLMAFSSEFRGPATGV